MKEFIKTQDFPRLPWKEVMFGEGLLNVIVGCSAWIAANSFSEQAYTFFHNLSHEQVQKLFLLAAKGILAFGFLNVMTPIVFVLFVRLLERNQELIKQPED